MATASSRVLLEQYWTGASRRAAAERSVAERVAFTTKPSQPGPAFAPLAMITALNVTGMPYVVIGGLAAAIHGSPRPTADLDLMIPSLGTRLVDVANFLRRFGATTYDGAGDTDDITPAWLAQRPAFPLLEFNTVMGGVDLDDYGFDTYRRFAAESTEVDVGGGEVARVASIEHLIELKRRANRPQDLDDIVVLSAIGSGVGIPRK